MSSIVILNPAPMVIESPKAPIRINEYAELHVIKINSIEIKKIFIFIISSLSINLFPLVFFDTHHKTFEYRNKRYD